MAADLQRMERAILKSLEYEGFPGAAEVSILLTNDNEIHLLNKNYRNIDSPTDVLSFSLLNETDVVKYGELIAIGDIVISIDTAYRQSRAQQKSLDDELELLVIHGMLHLLGYDDSADDLADIMRNREKGILNELINDKKQQ
jgi:probable rRNA maturation factor